MKRFNLLLFLIIVATMAQATIYYVSSSGLGTDGLSWETAYLSPAAALAGSPIAGDEVWVQQGTYVSASTLSWKTEINFYGGFVGTETNRSERSLDASLTILEGNNTERVLNAPAMASATIWSGFTIQKGFTSGGGAGIFMQKNAILENCIVQNNNTTDHGGAGIYIQGVVADTDSIKVLNCIVRNNTATKSGAAKRGGGGIYVKQGSHKTVIRGCIIENNVVDGLANSGSDINGGGIYLADGTLENSTIKNNTATNKNASTQALSLNGKCQGAGVFIMPQTTSNPIVVHNCTISGNEANTSQGGGISIDPLWSSAVMGSPVQISNSFIVNNSAYKNGGGVMTEGQALTSTADYTFENCVIANNESSAVAAGGGGVFVNNIANYAGAISFNNCTVVNNKMLTTNYGGAGIFYNNVEANISNCVFWGNGSVGAIYPYHVRVKNTLTTNKIVHCAFDNRFVEAQVSPEATPADLTGIVILDQANSGTELGKLYADFVSTTIFVGKAMTESDLSSLAIANWAILGSSALINAGKTISTLLTDIIGTERPQKTSYDIGAYEFDPGPSTKNINLESNMRIFAQNAKIAIENNAKVQFANIYNIMGSKVVSIRINEGLNFVSLPTNQLYIVKVGTQTVKVKL